MVIVRFHNVSYDPAAGGEKNREVILRPTPALTLEEAVGAADLSSYYPLSGIFSWNCQYVPYLLSNSRVRWNVPYSEASVADFLDTHSIPDQTISAAEGYPQAGGPGFVELAEIWNRVYPIIDQFVTLAGAAAIAGSVGRWIASLFRPKQEDVPPHSYLDLLFSRQAWNHFELARLLDITPEDSKRLLVSLGYQYDKGQLLYIQLPKALELKEKLSKVEVLDR